MILLLFSTYICSCWKPCTLLRRARIEPLCLPCFSCFHHTSRYRCYMAASFTKSIPMECCVLTMIIIYYTYPAMQVQWAATTDPCCSIMAHGTRGVADVRWECFTYNDHTMMHVCYTKVLVRLITFPLTTNLTESFACKDLVFPSYTHRRHSRSTAVMRAPLGIFYR